MLEIPELISNGLETLFVRPVATWRLQNMAAFEQNNRLDLAGFTCLILNRLWPWVSQPFDYSQSQPYLFTFWAAKMVVFPKTAPL